MNPSTFNAKSAGPSAVGDAQIPLATQSIHNGKTVRLKTPLLAKSPSQADYFALIDSNDVVFGLGPAGVGKTYVAVGMAVVALLSGQVGRIILSRPAIEAGERLGFLPGDMKEKVDPYFKPIYDALYSLLPADMVDKKIAAGEIEIAPIAFMRGRTLSDAFIILDEAQNTTIAQMKMFVTRFGMGSKMVICGDEKQCDITDQLKGKPNGLVDIVARSENSPGIAIHRFDISHVVRHPVVATFLNNYEKTDAQLAARPALIGMQPT